MDRKVIEVSGTLLTGLPRGCKRARPSGRPHPGGIPAGGEARRPDRDRTRDWKTGTDPAGLIFPSRARTVLRWSNFDRRVLVDAYLAAGWRDTGGNGEWTWYSLRHVFCVTGLFTWKLDAHRRVLHGRARRRPHHSRHVRRHHRRRLAAAAQPPHKHNLAFTYDGRDLGRTIPLYEQTLADSVRVLGADHPDQDRAQQPRRGAPAPS